MKKISTILLALLIVLCAFTACEKKDDATDGTVQSTVGSEGATNGDAGEEDTGSESTGDGKYYPTKMTKYDASGKATDEFFYNYEHKDGKVVKGTVVNGADTELARTEIEYDDKGNVLRESDYEGGEIYWAREYDAEGKIVKEYNYQEGQVYTYYENEYDANGNLVKTVSYDENGTAYRDLEYTHDEYGNVISEITYLYSGGSGKTEYDRAEYEYELNSEGKPVKKSDETTVYEYEYDAEGNMVKSSAYYDGKLWEVMEYDSHGNTVKESTYDAGNLVRYFVYEYTTF